MTNTEKWPLQAKVRATGAYWYMDDQEIIEGGRVYDAVRGFSRHNGSWWYYVQVEGDGSSHEHPVIVGDPGDEMNAEFVSESDKDSHLSDYAQGWNDAIRIIRDGLDIHIRTR